MTKKISILCFGNSLTEGYSQWGSSFTPYAKSMKAWLESSLSPTKIIVDVEGRSGDLITPPGNFLYRLTKTCNEKGVSYDWIIILGGTNDLGYGRQPEDIFAGLQECYEVAATHGAEILALTVPECSAKLEHLDRRRNELNNMIKEHEAEKFHVFDLHTAMPYHSMSEEDRDEIWDDGLHLTPFGYSVMGGHIAKRIKDLLEEKPTVDVGHASNDKADNNKEEAKAETETEEGAKD